jgi:regulator of protease activity HflC (stomatin/prohibitin superfamily)
MKANSYQTYQQPQTQGETMLGRKLITGLIGVAALCLTFLFVVSCEHIEGHERGVVQNWTDGVLPETLGPGTHFYFPLTTKIYKYNIGTEKFIMGNKALYNGDGSDYVDFQAVTFTTGGNGKEQPATFSVTLQYNLDASKLVDLHKAAQLKYDDLVIKPALTRIISDMSTTQTVLDFYSGEGRVNLQKNIERAITDHPELSKLGIIVNTFVIDDISLDPKYVAEITGRQIATQQKLRAIEETAAAEESAKKAQADAQADKNKRVVAAEASAKEQTLAAEAAKQKTVLDAQAKAEEVKTLAEASRFQKEQDAKGLLAKGMAEAQVDLEKKKSKYDGEAGARQAMVEIEQARTERLKNFKVSGVIPEGAAMTLINGDNFKAPELSLPITPPAPVK